jgi:hypothetical protein
MDWSNNKLVILGLVTLLSVIGTGATGTWAHLSSYWETQDIVQDEEHGLVAELNRIRLELEAEKAKAEQAFQSQKQILDVVQRIEKKMDTPAKTGRATVSSTRGPNESYIVINRRGNADMYEGQEEAKITYKDSEGLENSVILPVKKGGFRNDDPGHLFMFSVQAGRDLGLSGVIRSVRIGPTDGD